MLKRRRVFWVLIFAGWMLIGLSWALNYYFFSHTYVELFSRPGGLANLLRWELFYWFVWAAFIPLILKITRRFPVERSHRSRNLLVQVAAGLLLSLVHRVIFLVGGFLLYDARRYPLSTLFEMDYGIYFFNLPNGFLCYGTIVLISHVINYYERYQQEELKASRLKAELAEAQLQITRAQLQALKMQLHPHFLFNTLNSISALLDEDVEAADEMLARFGDFLRLTLENSGAQEVTLQAELEFLKCYLEIERVRFQDRLTVQMDIEPQTLDARVPNLVLQPIVENAIRHGIATRIAPGRIEIHSARDDGVLRLQVRDNGPGLPADSGLKEGLGLANTRARLSQMYGDAHRFEIAEGPEGGLQVILEIPFVTASAGALEEKAILR